MEYSAVSAGYALGPVVILGVHMLIGVSLIAGSMLSKTPILGLPGTSGRVLVGLAGLLFSGLGLMSIKSRVAETHACTSSLSLGQYVEVSGEVRLVERFRKAGAGRDVFLVGDKEFRTSTTRTSGDCGLIAPLGSVLTLETGDTVTVRAHNGHIVYLKINARG